MLLAAERGMDSGWPPILIAFVAAVVGALVISAVVVFRALRNDRRARRARKERRP